MRVRKFHFYIKYQYNTNNFIQISQVEIKMNFFKLIYLLILDCIISVMFSLKS